MVTGLADALAAVAADVAIDPSDSRVAPESRESQMWWHRFAWMGRPARFLSRYLRSRFCDVAADPVEAGALPRLAQSNGVLAIEDRDMP